MGRTIILILVGALLICSISSAYAASFSQNLTVTVLPGGIFLKVNSPIEGKVYDNRQIPVDIQFGAGMESFMLTDNDHLFRTLCRGCSSYNQTKPFDDGKHTITIKVVHPVGTEVIDSINFTVDSTPPRIVGFINKQITNGTFYFSFQEVNPKTITFYAESGNLTQTRQLSILDCQNKNPGTECKFSIDINQFDGKTINYWYNLTDIVGKSVKSEKEKTLVDTSRPVINSFNAGQFGIFSLRFLTIKLNITEQNLDSVMITTTKPGNSNSSVTTVLCSALKNGICQKTKIFSSGDKFWIRVLDKAGNSVSTEKKTI